MTQDLREGDRHGGGAGYKRVPEEGAGVIRRFIIKVLNVGGRSDETNIFRYC